MEKKKKRDRKTVALTWKLSETEHCINCKTQQRKCQPNCCFSAKKEKKKEKWLGFETVKKIKEENKTEKKKQEAQKVES